MGTMGPSGAPPMAPPGGQGGTSHASQGGDGDAFSLVPFGDNVSTSNPIGPY